MKNSRFETGVFSVLNMTKSLLFVTQYHLIKLSGCWVVLRTLCCVALCPINITQKLCVLCLCSVLYSRVQCSIVVCTQCTHYTDRTENRQNLSARQDGCGPGHTRTDRILGSQSAQPGLCPHSTHSRPSDTADTGRTWTSQHQNVRTVLSSVRREYTRDTAHGGRYQTSIRTNNTIIRTETCLIL